MKKALLATASIFMSITAMAQLPVSTTPSNKNVILEEFTGIHCVFCPDGHKRAEQIRSANPNDVFLVNIHTGGYATPQTGEPDFRTTFGSALAGQSGLTGYPSGTVNRHVFSGSSTAMGRGNWAAASNTILGEASYVNVALEADIDVVTRVMTVDLEAYFTANGASSMNINIVVTQNNVEGPQTGGSTYNPGNILPNGNYNHGHMLRHMITGQWGDVITTTSMGTTVTKQYTWTIPSSIRGVDVELVNLQVIGFIVEGHQEIITGAEGPISFSAPTGTSIVDLESTDGGGTSYCETNITPTIKVSNLEDDASAGYLISYSIDGGSLVSKTINSTLNGNSFAFHAFNGITVTPGEHQIEYFVELLSGAPEIEVITKNNASGNIYFRNMQPSQIGNVYTEDFESYSDGVASLNNVDMTSNQNVEIASENISSLAKVPVGGYALSAKSLRYYLYDMDAGDHHELVTYKVDLTSNKHSFLSFDYAFAGKDDIFSDRLEVFVSGDCGETWRQVFDKAGNDLATGNSLPIPYFPSASEWETELMDISFADYFDEALIKFVVTASSKGNSLFIDNISTGSSWPLSATNLVSTNEISIFPNPASTTASLKLTVDENQKVDIRIYDLSGRTIQYFNSALTTGSNIIDLETNGLTNGVYFVEVSSDSKTTTRRLVIQK